MQIFLLNNLEYTEINNFTVRCSRAVPVIQCFRKV